MKSATGCGIKRRKNYVHIFGLRAWPRPLPGGGLRAHHALLLQALLYLRGDR